MIPAHGIGGRADLPLPGELVLQAGGFVVLVSFLAVGLLWKQPRFADDPDRQPPGHPLPAVVQRAADTPALRWTLRGLTLALLAYLIVVAFVGPLDVDHNPAPRALYVLAWVGVVPVSLLLGPVWRVLNPLRALHVVLARVLRVPRTGVRPAPEHLGYWPTAIGLAMFVWLELVPADRADPPVVGGFLLAYAVLITAAATVFGEGFFERGDPFEVYSTLVAALAPVARADGGTAGEATVAWRNPLRGLAAVRTAPGLVAVLAVWWGSTVFDGLSGTTFWINTGQRAGAEKPLLSTAVLVALFGLVGLSYRLATGAMARTLVSTLVPIAVGYTIAHYASLLLTEGPRGLAQLVGAPPPTVTVAPLVIAAIQVTAILVGHVVGVLAAHDRVLALDTASVGPAGTAVPGTAAGTDPHTPTRRLADQVPLVLIMIVYTMVGLYILVIA